TAAGGLAGDEMAGDEGDPFKGVVEGSNSKALSSITYFQDSDSDVEEDTRSSKEFLADLNLEFHYRTLLSNQKRFYRFSGRVGVAKKPMEESNETCFPFGKQGHFQKDCPNNKTSSPSYMSSNKTHNKNKFHTNTTSSSHQHNQTTDNGQKDYKVRYKALNAKLALLTQKIKVVSKNKSEKGLVAESYDWDEESLSSKDEGVTTVRAFMGIVEDELVGKKTNDEVSDLKRVIEKWTSSKVTLDQLLTEQILGNIVRAMGRRGKRKETISSKDVMFFKGEKYPFETAYNSTSNTESVNDNQDPLPPLPKLLGAELVGTSNDVIPPTNLIQTSTISDKTKQVTEKESLIKYVKKKA
ncbi:retrovirus-related pol polyprotein from transposon TNT 1-94, partial [Tanacetum coccineum]